MSTLHFLDSTLSAPGRRTSVSAPMGNQPKTPAPMGRQTARPEKSNPRPSAHRAARVQNQRHGSADLCVRPLNGPSTQLSTFSTLLSRPPAAGPLCPPAGQPTANLRPDGQRTRWDRKRPFRTWRRGCSLCVADESRPAIEGTGGQADPGLFSARRGGALPTNTQRSGHRGPPPRRPVSGPRRTVCADGHPAETGASPIPICSRPSGTLVSRRMPSGADTEVRAPANRLLARQVRYFSMRVGLGNPIREFGPLGGRVAA